MTISVTCMWMHTHMHSYFLCNFRRFTESLHLSLGAPWAQDNYPRPPCTDDLHMRALVESDKSQTWQSRQGQLEGGVRVPREGRGGNARPGGAPEGQRHGSLSCPRACSVFWPREDKVAFSGLSSTFWFGSFIPIAVAPPPTDKLVGENRSGDSGTCFLHLSWWMTPLFSTCGTTEPTTSPFALPSTLSEEPHAIDLRSCCLLIRSLPHPTLICGGEGAEFGGWQSRKTALLPSGWWGSGWVFWKEKNRTGGVLQLQLRVWGNPPRTKTGFKLRFWSIRLDWVVLSHCVLNGVMSILRVYDLLPPF